MTLRDLVSVSRSLRGFSGLGLIAVATLIVGGALAFPERSLADPPAFNGKRPSERPG